MMSLLESSELACIMIIDHFLVFYLRLTDKRSQLLESLQA